MLKRYLPLIACFVIAVSCSKDKLETKPSIKIKSVNGTQFVPNINVPVLINLEFADSEGDLGGGVIKYYRNRLNILYPVTNKLEDSASYVIPEFSNQQRGEIELRITADRLNENPDFNDTVSWKIIVVDKAGNVSDTVETAALNDLSE